MKKAYLITTIIAALVAVSSTAQAQVRNPWHGFYVGLHGGYNWQDVGGIFDTAGDPVILAGDLNGGIVGGQVGFNYQSGQFLLGLEVDLSTLADGGHTVIVDPGTPAYEAFSLDMTYLGSVRGRLGWAINNWLLFGSVGWGYSEFKFTADLPGFYDRIRIDDNGLVYGGGVEWMVAYGISLRAEYLRYDLSRDASIPAYFPGADPGDRFGFDNIDVARAALNIKLGK